MLAQLYRYSRCMQTSHRDLILLPFRRLGVGFLVVRLCIEYAKTTITLVGTYCLQRFCRTLNHDKLRIRSVCLDRGKRALLLLDVE
jgi:hypothetical protein